MDDLRHRFANLDRLRAPDLWDEIGLRAAALGSTGRLTPVPIPLPVRSRGFSGRSLVVLAAVALLVGLLAGAIAVGSGLVKLPAILLPDPSPWADATPQPSPWQVPSASGAAIDRCNPGVAGGPGWPGPAMPPGSASDVRPGLIAGWAIQPNRQLVTIADPDGGTTTQLTHTPITYSNYEGGVVEWSPDGRALAVGWAQRDCQDLFVASGGAFTRASAAPVDAWRWSWSPDSSRLAATVGESNVVIIGQDGHTIDLGTPCDRCLVLGDYSPHGLSWSPDGSFLAAPYAIIDPEADVIVEAGVAFTDASRPTWRTHSFDEAWIVAVVGWVDDDHLLVNRAIGDDERGQLLKLSATTPDDAEALAIEVPSGSAPSLVQIAPDRASVMISTGWQARPQAVVVAELATGDQAVVYSGEASVVTSAWSPDSSAVAVVTGTGSAYGGGYERYEMAVLELATGAQQVVWTGLTDGGGLVWSPDSSQLAISGGPENGLWVVNRDGSRLRRVSDTPLWFMSWQPVWP